MDGDTFNSISDNCSLIGSVSNERIRDEIVKIITQNNPGDGLKLLNETGLLKEILPDVHTMIGIEQPPQFHPEGDVFIHTCLVLDKLYKNTRGKYSLELAMGALLHDVGKPPTFEVSDRIRFNGHDRVGAGMAKGICRNLKFSKKQIERIVSLIREHLKFKDVRNMRQSTLKRFLQWKYYEKAATLVYPTDIPKFDEVAFRVKDDLNITSYELKELIILDPEDEEMPTTVRVVVTYYKFPSVAVKTAVITDTWIKPGKTWLIKSDFNSEIFND